MNAGVRPDRHRARIVRLPERAAIASRKLGGESRGLVSRIIDMYPSGQQNQIRSMLSTTLQAVVSQTLFTRADKPGMIPAVEVLLCTPAVRNLIRENKVYEIPNVIETSRQIGMTSLDSSIAELYFNGSITKEDAIAQAVHPDKLERQLVA